MSECITIIVLMNSGSAPDVLSFLLMFATYTSPFKLLLDWLGSMGMVDLSNEMLQIYFIFEIVISLVDAIATTVSMMIPFILGIVTVVIAFKGAGKKAKKGSHIVCIVFGVISYLYINTMLGILMLVGGIFGVIADGKDAKKLEEARRKQKIKALPYYKKA